MDLDQFDTISASEAGIEVEIVDPRTGKGAGIFFKVKGPDSEVYRRTIMDRARKDLELKRALTIDEIGERSVDLIVALTIGWRGLEEKGREIEFSPEEAKRVYTGYPEVRRQIDRVINDRLSFFPISPRA